MVTEVYDLEVLQNLFTYTGYCLQDKKYYHFIIHKDFNQAVELYNHLKRDSKMAQVGFNNENFDYPLEHYFLTNYERLRHLSGQEIAIELYDKAQQLIESTEYTGILDKHKIIIQYDLFRIWHYNNKARLTSLKDLQFVMQMDSIEEMPFDHTHWITTQEEINDILKYNKHDVESTLAFLNVTLGNTNLPLYSGKNKLELRLAIKKKFKVNGLNFNDIKLGTELILKLYCEKFRVNPKDVRKLKTPRKEIYLKECLPQWMNFQTNKFDSVIKEFSNIVIHNGETKGKVDFSVIYHGIKIDYGTGGAHACIKPGVYDSDDEFGIYDLDIDSLYPMLGITQGLYPEHLGPGFLDIYYGEIVSKRLEEKKKPKKERDFVIVEGFKLAANGSYGKTNEEKSWLYDPLYTMKTTISGQIFISMWAEYICENIPQVTILQVNTDGLTFRLPKKYKEKMLNLSDEITTRCKLTYEMNEYDKMVIRDVNNYSARYLDGKIKHKGDFEIHKELHKDPSMKIVSIALEKYFFNEIPIKETIINHSNIYDFCLRLKVNKGASAMYKTISNDGRFNIKKLSKNTRYYISNNGGVLYKQFNDKTVGVNIGYSSTLFNKYIEKPMKNYNINYQFYMSECNKIINQIESKQLSLF